MHDKEMIMNISMHISTCVDAYCDIYIGILYWYRQFCVCAWRPSCIYTHTHTHPSGGRAEGGGGREGPQAVFVYMLVLFLSFPKSGIFDFIIPDFGKGILCVFVKKEPFVKNIYKKAKLYKTSLLPIFLKNLGSSRFISVHSRFILEMNRE